LITPIEEAWAKVPAEFPNYQAGSTGPVSADKFLAASGHTWSKLE